MAKQSSSNRHKAAKTSRNRIPPPQRQRVLQKFAAGKSVVEIAKEEARDRGTISRITRGPEMEEFVTAMRTRFYSMGCDAMNAIQHTLRNDKDGRLGFQILASIGVIPSERERERLAARRSMEDTSYGDGVKKIMSGLIEGIVARAAAFDMPVPELEEDLKRAGGRINRSTGRIEPID
jgi:hypothetical protein